MSETTLSDFVNIMTSLPGAKKRANGTHISIRCPYCGDSKKHKDESHFYISLNTPLMFNCKLCPVGGVLNRRVMRKIFPDYNRDLEEFVQRYNSKFIRKGDFEDASTNFSYILNNAEFPYDEVKYAKPLTYLRSRLVGTIGRTYIKENRIVLNVKDFIMINKLEGIIDCPKDKKLETYLSMFDNFVGFLSYTHKGINCRVFQGNYSERYYTFPFINSDKMKGTIHFYVPETKIDLMTEHPRIVLQEGPFDSLNVKHKYFENANNMFLAGVGSKGSYLSALKHIINLTGFVDAIVDIFSDPEVPPTHYSPLATYLGYHVNVYYNKKEFDYGDKDRIGDLRKVIVQPQAPKKDKTLNRLTN